MEVEGVFPRDKGKMLDIIDRFLSLPEGKKLNFRLGKRSGIYGSMADMSNPMLHAQVEALRDRIEREVPGGVEAAISKIKESYL